MMSINIKDPIVQEALFQVSRELSHPIQESVDKAFERKYNCEIVSQDPFGIEGYIYFPEEKYQTAFLLQFSSNKSNTRRLKASWTIEHQDIEDDDIV